MVLHTVGVELPDIAPKLHDTSENGKLSLTAQCSPSSFGSVIPIIARASLLHAEIILATQTLKPPTYAQILRLDEKVMADYPQFQTDVAPPPSMSTS
jgi:hypothetical protein